MGQAIKRDLSILSATLLFRIDNLKELLDAYGPEFHFTAFCAVQERLLSFGIALGAIVMADEFVLVDLSLAGLPLIDSHQHIEDLMQRMREEISRDPVECGANRAYLMVHTDVFYAAVNGAGQVMESLESVALASRHGRAIIAFQDRSRHALRVDMLAATALLDELRAGDLVLEFQPIQLLEKAGKDSCLYSETLLRRSSRSVDFIYPLADAIGALERLGWIDRLDCSVIWTVVRLLKRYPDQRLGCNVSAASLRKDVWWTLLLVYLNANRDVAGRLTLEITETSVIMHSSQAMALIEDLQFYGAHIALDDMGAGHSSLEFLSTAGADVVKIDRSILLRACDLGHSPDLLRNLVQVCADYCPCVVVEGVETTAELRVARYAGAQAIQGFLIQKPSKQPEWLRQENAVVIDAFGEFDHDEKLIDFSLLR